MKLKLPRRSPVTGSERLVSTIATILMLEFSVFLALCQLAVFPITLGDVGFHSFLILLPFAAAAPYVSLPVYLGCAALIGVVLPLRVQTMPLDFYELMFSNPLGTVPILCFFALILWLFVRGTARLVSRGTASTPGRLSARSLLPAAGSLFASSFAISTLWILYLVAIFSTYGYADFISFFTGGLWSADSWAQVIFDWVVWLDALILVQLLVDRVATAKTEPLLATVFQRWLFLVVVGAFLLTTSVSFLFSTVQASAEASDSLGGQASYLLSQVTERAQSGQPIDGIVKTYSGGLNETVVVLEDGRVVSSNAEGAEWLVAGLDLDSGSSTDLLASNEMRFVQDVSTGGITYVRAASEGRYAVIVLASGERVFANRTSAIALNALCYLVLFSAVFVLVSNLLKRVVVQGFRRTNSILAKITEGDLSQQVAEHETQEFSELSDGINTTVDALKYLIGEAERRMEHDLATAKAIQESALPRTFPPFPEVDSFDIFASMSAAKEVGGDFYDFFLVDDSTLGFLIADVSGKGIPGALFMMAAKAELENFMLSGMGLADAVREANRVLCANNDAGMFVTVWAATLDWESGRVTFVNAGHNFPLLRHAASGKWEWLTKKCGLFLGTFETAKYRQEELVLEPGDKLVLYTDGVNEAFNVDEREYGNDRLEAYLAANGELGPRELAVGLRADVAAWAEGAEQSDDVTILVLEYTGA